MKQMLRKNVILFAILLLAIRNLMLNPDYLKLILNTFGITMIVFLMISNYKHMSNDSSR